MDNNPTYNVLKIIRGTTVDGPGFRTSIYLAGCRHNCPGCHNPQSHDPDAGYPMLLSEIMGVVEEEDFNVTLTGGDPLYDPEMTQILIARLKQNRRNVWVYTGFTWDEIIRSPILLECLKLADVVVDGKFIQELRDIDLRFRGSSNQRLIDIQKSLFVNKIILFED